MLAAFYVQRGTSDVLQVGEVATPGPGVGEVRVRLQVAAVNPTDWKSRSNPTPMDFDYQVPGQDGAGVIEAVGPGVDIGRIGERVWVYLAAAQRQFGTAAQFTVVPSRQAVAIPDGIPTEQAAALGVPYLTAYACLMSDGPIDGQTVLVHGGAGAVGHAAVQLARRAGAHVIATVSGELKGQIAAAAGAHVVIDYTDAGAVDAIAGAARAGVDRIIEVDLTANLDLDLAVLVPWGVIATYAADAVDPTIPVRRLMVANVVLRFMMLYGFSPALLGEGTREITAALEARDLSPLPTVHFPLDDIAAAHDAVQSRTLGKVLVELP
ncbi:MAG: NADPH:quinone reductase [Candidatus Nanopelagicales bacterium]|jgi:NADPH:quinone reductase|nr:NADPH:quinone reductase [Candidatus Nanopelagicales bacterium]MDP4715010.1 NADPH:quinone reductase [Candidatus Nanopelagicales bacterium]MDP4906223.1 NADPH:quinone reductase [Candidatus Nanopelagicales bacterium]MDP4974089.1 NADPH:quinone reductase [Candidatus Nanopelagicales bacterium]MDP5095428.1 NADPH:quinone reductase [Candidatus Nanopelagicales bacterium]